MKHFPHPLARSVLPALVAFACVQVPVAAAAAAVAPAAPAAPAAAAASQPAAAPAPAGRVDSTAVFARVGDTVISFGEYVAAFNAAVRAKFYHGKPPEAELAKLQHEVADKLVARVALLAEVRRRGLRPLDAQVQQALRQQEQRYANQPQWKANKDKWMPVLLARLGEENQLAQLEQSVRAAAIPDEAAVRAYYESNPDKFTEPVRSRAAMILLRVDASAPDAQWEEAGLRAEGLVKRIRAGEDFGAIAKQFSDDKSAANGGDLGYLHGGMMSDAADATLAALQVGQTSDPQRILEGIAVFRLIDRTPARLQPYQAVRERARELARRSMADQAWNGFVAAQVAKVEAQVDRSRFLPLGKHAGPTALQ